MVKLRRISVVERYILDSRDLTFEAKKDLEDLKEYLGDDLFNSYMKIRDRIPSSSDLNKSYPEYTGNLIKDNKEKEFVKKYNNIKKNLLVVNNAAFSEYPNSIESVTTNNLGRTLNAYNKMRDYILSTLDKYRDFSKLKKQDKKYIQSFIDSFQSKSDKKKSDKTEGAEKLYEDSDWVVYRITSYSAAQLYGSGTKWCITGRYPGHEERGQTYFDDYIIDNNLDGGYYFYLNKNNPKEKYCLLQTKDKKIHSIWDAKDTDKGNSLSQLNVKLPKVGDINIPKYGINALFEAIRKDDLRKVKQILKTSEDLLEYHNKYSQTPLMVACIFDSYAIAEFLISKGADVNVEDENGYTPLIKALEEKYNDIVNLLVNNGADVNLKARNERTPIIVAVKYHNNKDIVELLLNNGANVNVEDEYGGTPIMTEIKHNSKDKVELLLNNGADVNVEDVFGLTPLILACDYGVSLDIIKSLVEHGADVNAKNKYGNTALYYAKTEDVIELLKKYGAKE